VHFAGWRPDVAEILAAADALVLPSRWEGMPNVVLEAMAAGKPVVTRCVEGVAELLGDLPSEQVVEQSDEKEAIADRLIHFIQNPQFAADIGSRNQKKVAAQFSIEAMVAQYEQLYAAILDR
jgi:glycosyltransferase involved in cell wall biosynthesis